MDKNRLDKCIEDLRKTIEADKTMKGIQGTVDNINTNNYLEYALKHGIIKNLEEVFYIVGQHPDLSSVLNKAIEKLPKTHKLHLMNESNADSSSSHRNEYKSTIYYDHPSELPGYGTEFNDRCIPSHYVKRSNNQRC